MTSYMLFMVIKFLALEQWKDGVNDSMNAETTSKAKHDPADLLPQQPLKTSNKFV